MEVSLPWIELPSFPGRGSMMNLALMADLSLLILCVYSKLEAVRATRWSERTGELEREGYRIVALSGETLKTHQQWASRAKLAYPVVSDSELQLAPLLGLPTLETGEGIRVYEDLTLVTNGTIAEVFYPLEHPNDDAAKVMSRIRRVDADRGASGGLGLNDEALQARTEHDHVEERVARGGLPEKP